MTRGAVNNLELSNSKLIYSLIKKDQVTKHIYDVGIKSILQVLSIFDCPEF